MDPLAPLREKIDQVDRQLVALLNERLRLAAEIGHCKRLLGGEIYSPSREDAVLRKVSGLNAGPLRPEAVQAIYREIMSAALALEKPGFTIAFSGPEGSRAHVAAIAKFGTSVAYRSLSTIAGIFAAMERAEVDYAVVPFELSPATDSSEMLDRLVGSGLKLIARLEGATSPGPAIPELDGPPARFFVLGRKSSGPGGGGSYRSAYLVTPGGSGTSPINAVQKCLFPLVERGIGIPTVALLPDQSPGSLVKRFFIEVSGHHDDPDLRAAWAESAPTGALVQWLGSYPVAI